MILDWDEAYSNSGHVAGSEAFAPRWSAEAAAFRAQWAASARLDLAYGADARQRLDLFLPAGSPKGLFAFIHGGYWLRFDKSYWSHFALGALERGWAVALPSYRLAPAVRVADIVRDAAAAIRFAAREIAGPLRLAGHSAGGHLVTRMASHNSPLDAGTAARVEAVVSISGVHDLRPLLRTQMNATLRLDLAEAEAESPALLRPAEGARVTCWVGAAELPEFLRQNDLLANIWTGLGAEMTAVHAPARHHFDVVEPLADPDSDLTRLCAP